jgi:proline dehydrogenase
MVSSWSIARRAASRFIAGEAVADALKVILKLNDRGMYASLDHLGENVTTIEEAERATNEYIEVLQRMEEAAVKANVSVKLSQLGLNLDFELCLANMQSIASRAAQNGTMMRIDMEDSPTIDRTLQIFHNLREKGLTNVGLVFQSYLYRSEEDLRQVLKEGAHIRLCKGAYNEPADVAFPRKKDADENFDKLSAMIIDSAHADGAIPASQDGKVPPVTAIASHDEKRIEFATEYASKVGFPVEALEFQMLHGIRSDLQVILAEKGYPVRIYIPFGTEWYPYFVRRLAERPANLWFFISNLIRG